MNLRRFFVLLMILLAGGINCFGQSFSAVKSNEALIKREAPVADFFAEDTVVTAGDALNFTSLSTGNPTFFCWTIEGASPSVVYLENPMVVYNMPGVYDVQLIISNSAGSDTLIKHDYIHVLEEQSQLPPGWEYNPSLTQHTIIIFQESNPRIFESPIQPGDYIGVFYEDDYGDKKCGGAILWDGTGNTAIVAQGDNFLTQEKDGFMIGETFTWKLYSWESQQDFPAGVIYDSQLQLDAFVPNAVSGVQDISAGTRITIAIPQGWSGVSSHVQPWGANLSTLFASHLNDVEMIFDGTGYFRPDENINTIGNWENKGYQVKLRNSISLEVSGYAVDETNIDIASGWNMIPVPVNCAISISDLPIEQRNEILIVQEIAGNKVFYPEFNIHTLQHFEPGKAYLLKSSGNFILNFNACE